MNVLSGLFLGIIQGLTEFLPISSSGHLVFFQNLMGFGEQEILFDVSLHMGTLLAVFIFFWSDIRGMILETVRFVIDVSKKRGSFSSIKNKHHVALTLWVIAGTIPTGIIGVIFKDPLEELFGRIHWVGVMLTVTGLILLITRFINSEYMKRNEVGLIRALAVGISQGMAIIPGISRSGSTIVCGMLCGIDRELAARFSFLLSIPAIMGAMVLQFSSSNLGRVDIIPMAVGFLSAAITGLLALKLLMKMVRKGNLVWFSPYCILLGLAIIFFM